MAPYGYYEVAHTPGLWRHVTRPVQFTLVVDDFGVKYVGEENAKHLIQAIRKRGYKLGVDWTGSRYCRITLDWNYDEHTLVILMPGYVQKMLVRFKHDVPKTNQNSPYQPAPRKFGKNSDDTIPKDTTKKLDDKRKKGSATSNRYVPILCKSG